MHTSYEIGRNVRRIRKERGLTILDLSEIINFSTTHITQVELGTRSMSIDMLVALSEGLDTDPNTIIGIEKKHKKIEIRADIDKIVKDKYDISISEIISAIKESV